MSSYDLTLFPQDLTLKIDEEVNLLERLRQEEIYIKSGCGGHASCSDCIIKIIAGEGNLNEPTFDETKLLGNVFHITKERLACQTKCTGNVKIDLSNHNEFLDQMKLQKKNSSFQKKSPAKVRKRDEVEQMYTDRATRRQEKEVERAAGPQKQSGFKRPKPFRTDHLDDEEDS